MPDLDLANTGSTTDQTGHQFGRNQRALGVEVDSVEYFAPEQLESAINIPEAEPE